MTEQQPLGEQPAEPTENLLSAGSLARDAGRGIVDGVKDEVAGWVFTGLTFLCMFLAVLLPIGGLVVGGIFLWLAIANGRSKFVPLLTMIASIAFWVMGKSPLGMLPAVLAVLG